MVALFGEALQIVGEGPLCREIGEHLARKAYPIRYSRLDELDHPPLPPLRIFCLDGQEQLETITAALGALPPESPRTPGLLISRQTRPLSLEQRLGLLRAGIGRFMGWPNDADLLEPSLTDLLGKASPEPYRVLVINDDSTLSRYYAALLDDRGLQARTVSDVGEICSALSAFLPDVKIGRAHV